MGDDRLQRACFSFLVPVARFLLLNGVSFREFERLARAAFVKVSGEEFGIRGRQTNISRVAAITGIPRKEVRRIRNELSRNEVTPRGEISPLGDVLHHWHTDTRFLDQSGNPAPLPIDGPGASFEQLTRLASGDLPSGALKSELLRTGAITQTDDDCLVPTGRQAVPSDITDRLITSLSFNLFGLASTIAFNSNAGRTGEGRIERFVQSKHIPSETRDSLRTALRKQIEQFTVDLDDQFSRAEVNSIDDIRRVGVGVYYYEDDS